MYQAPHARPGSPTWVWIATVCVIAMVAALYVLSPAPRRAGPHPRSIALVRGLFQGMVLYAQNNRDAFPPPDEARALLIGNGSMAEEHFESPDAAPREPAFFAVLLADPAAPWGNTFMETRPIVYANPAFDRGMVTVALSDGSTELMSSQALADLIRKCGGRVVPIR